jgi:TPP-dependent indolepyruvate ferredoxin oxidoreductase alpha subunit
VIFEDLVEALGMARPVVMDPTADPAGFQSVVAEALDSGAIRVIVARRDCLLATSKIKSYEQALKQEACLVPIE